MSLAVAVLLALGVAAQWVCALGVLVMRGPYDKLHYAGAGTTVGPLLVAVAVFLRQGWGVAGFDTIATLALVVLPAPALQMAFARAARRVDADAAS